MKLQMETSQSSTEHLRDDERQRCEVWTRVMGYHRPTSEFNPGKKSEHRERCHFDEGRAAPFLTP
jgi:anaerobic ribonucleoside-triphosphate reductase